VGAEFTGKTNFKTLGKLLYTANGRNSRAGKRLRRVDLYVEHRETLLVVLVPDPDKFPGQSCLGRPAM
jgi:hypothetical protein